MDLAPDVGAADAAAEPLRDDEIVDSPPRVVLPGPPPVAPPGIGPGLVRVQRPEGVHKAGGQELGHFPPFLVGEAGIPAVGAGIFQVDLLVGHVQVPAVDHRLFPVQLAKVLPEIVLPGHAVIQTEELVLGVGGIAADQVKVRELRRDDPPLVAVLVDSKVIGDVQRLPPGEDGGAGVARLVRAVPEALVAGEIKLRLLRAHFRLLKADDVRAGEGAEVQEALFQAGPKAVDVPGNQSHKSTSLKYSNFSSPIVTDFGEGFQDDSCNFREIFSDGSVFCFWEIL